MSSSTRNSPVVDAHQVGAVHGDVDAARHVQIAHLAAIVFGAVDHIHRHHAVLDDLTLVVDIMQEQVERGETLAQAALDRRPFAPGDDARDQVVGEDAFGALRAAVDGESNALVEERQVCRALAAVQFVRRQGEKVLVEALVMLPRLAARSQELIVCPSGVVVS